MKASRAAIKTAKAVKAGEERLAAAGARLGAIETRLTRIEKILQQLVAAVSADKPSEQGQDAPPKEKPKARTVRKRGGA